MPPRHIAAWQPSTEHTPLAPSSPTASLALLIGTGLLACVAIFTAAHLNPVALWAVPSATEAASLVHPHLQAVRELRGPNRYTLSQPGYLPAHPVPDIGDKTDTWSAQGSADRSSPHAARTLSPLLWVLGPALAAAVALWKRRHRDHGGDWAMFATSSNQLDRRSTVQMIPNIKLTYFDIEGAAEKVRLALVLSGTPFEDDRLSFQDWGARKPETPYGQLPVMTVDGEEMAQSPAMLRWVGRTCGDGSLYPTDPQAQFEVEAMLALSDDLARAWAPCLYLSFSPWKYGHAEDISPEAKGEMIKSLRQKFLAEEIPRFMGYFERQLEKTGAFFAGDKVTIADLQILPQLRYWHTNYVEHIPLNCLAGYPNSMAWMDRMYAIPAIHEWYESKESDTATP
uniref:Glutathione transferase n=1 Tax=Eutreptiella gymnastica TaxID=73025 RepID=A0A7S1IXQ5_9EUGL